MDAPLFTLIDIVIFVTIFQGFVFFLVTTAAVVKAKILGIVIAAVFLTHVVNPLGHFVGNSVTADTLLARLPMAVLVGADVLYGLVGPLFFLYARSLFDKRGLNSREMSMLLAPAAIHLAAASGFLLWSYFSGGSTPKAATASQPPVVMHIVVLLRNIFHVALAALLLVEFHRAFKPKTKSDSRADSRTVAALSALLATFTFFFLWDVVASGLRGLNAAGVLAPPASPGAIAIAFLVAHIVAMLFLNFRCFVGLVVTPRLRTPPAAPRYKPTDLEALEAHMRDAKPYLNAGINLERLARSLGMSPKTLSALINNEHKKSFAEYINEYRIVEAKRRLSGSREDHPVSITDLIYECGFNSKATFNRTFKNIVGKTPSEYRDSLHPPS